MKTLLGSAFAPREPDLPLDASAIEPALDRIGASHSPARLSRLNTFKWFVELSQLDLRRLSPAELLAKQEEYGALQRHLWNAPNPYLPPQLDLETLKIDVSKHVTQFLDIGTTMMGPFSVYIHLWDARFQGKRPPWSKSGIEATPRKAGRVRLMLAEMATLFKEFGTYVLRCPRCSKIFVKPRANAGYCSRSCQNAHYMENLRRVANEKKPSQSSKKGERKHGKKKR